MAFVVATSGFFVNIASIEATVSSSTVAGVASEDLVVGKEDAKYNFSFETDNTNTASVITITFPTGYVIDDGTIGAAADVICNSGCTTNGSISMGEGNLTVNSVVGSTANRTITITLNDGANLSLGTIGFRIKSGVQNPTTAGTTGDFAITTDATGEIAETDISGVLLVASDAETVTVQVQPTETVAGQTIEGPPTAKVVDEYGNVVSGVGVTASLASGSFSGGTTTVTTATNGLAEFSLTITTASSYELVFDAGVTTDATSSSFDVIAASESTVDFANITATQTAGVAFDLQSYITNLKDAYGNTVTDTSYNVVVTSSEDGALFDDDIAFLSGAANAAINVTLSTAGLHTLTVNVGAATDTATVTVKHAAHDSFLVTPSTTTPTAGVAIDLTIAAIDEFGNVLDGSYGATAYTGEVWISTTASTPYDIPFSYAYLSGDGGTKTFTSGVLFETAEDGVSITVRDNDDPTIYATVTGINVAASDTTPPVITSMSLDKPAYRLTQDPNVTVVVVEDNTADDVLINGTSGTEDPAGTWTRAFAHGKATAGMYSFTVIASDSTGNENINTVWYSVIEDDDPAAPVVAITSPSAGATVDGSTTIQFTTNSGATTDAYISIDGGTYVTATTNANPGTYVLDTTTLSNGSHTLRVKDTVDGVTGYSDYLTFIVNNLEEPTSVTVDRIERTETYATADGTYANGWEWVFHITVPTAETQLYMKFKDWTSGSNTIEVAENMRYYSAQSSNASAEGSAIEIAEAEEYPETAMLLNSDLDAFTGGRQIKVVVQAKVPAGTAGGSYSTSYKVLSEEVAE